MEVKSNYKRTPKDIVHKWEKCKDLGSTLTMRCHTMNTIGSSIYFFGGESGALLRNQLVSYNTVNRCFAYPYQGSTSPLARWGHSSTVIDDTKLLVFGGRTISSYLNDVWIYDTENDEWKRIACSGALPSPRWCHSATLIEPNKLLIFGGNNEAEGKKCNEQIHVLHLDTMSWKIQQTTGTYIARESHSAALVKNKLYIFGGCGNDENTLNDMCVLDIEKMHFSSVSWTSATPAPRQGSACAVVGPWIYYFGGEYDSTDRLKSSEVLIFNSERQEWLDNSTFPSPTSSKSHRVNIIGDEPSRRGYAAATAVGTRIFLFGGDCGNRATNPICVEHDFYALETYVTPDALLTSCVKFICSSPSLLSNAMQTDSLPYDLKVLLKKKKEPAVGIEVDDSQMEEKEGVTTNDDLMMIEIQEIASILQEETYDAATMMFQVQQICTFLDMEISVTEANFETVRRLLLNLVLPHTNV
eukprot:TRINITY_DN6792_c0_g1_i1.p1 TRINITY_DN6792_c0_g1~~TRINITY_DN6792_c0_g1_i1.p1  ORF type:complete len:470 (+),score=49.08 TRINITY_DN6792_c0_g1_i1:48-1457(+)